MGRKRTWYVDDILDKELHRIKTEYNFRSMNEVFRYLVFEKMNGNELESSIKKINIMDKNICILIEMMTMQLDTHGLVPNFSYTENLSTSYNAAKQLVENAIEEKMRLKAENEYFNI
ncbi:hypothetical protein D6861_004420 [Macrococcoides caseolyticum]|uniref:Uncharacterized protein n=1 Tax=Macrococcoides canis TaxID=1855823 RepID=A0A6G5ZY16_9STAP|nr:MULTISPECIES: hypothetical protein [Macrococcus]MBQ5152542.1 hypothetical protein [Macrococcus caseolyticus]QHW12297.1 hypothetical protein 0076A_00010 [Macrococcus canis]QIH77384.1 hypothetical protein GTN30_01700 [Macrococcus canis]RAI80818.1 hypothetical protein BFS34_004890 [Macrococcus caseolyticus subsp. hominis]RKO15512.1 hypothetical protein D6861_04505 [Macrococcus caseolyticus]